MTTAHIPLDLCRIADKELQKENNRLRAKIKNLQKENTALSVRWAKAEQLNKTLEQERDDALVNLDNTKALIQALSSPLKEYRKAWKPLESLWTAVEHVADVHEELECSANELLEHLKQL